MAQRTSSPFARLVRGAFVAFVVAGTLGLIALGYTSWQREQRDVRENLGVLSGFLAAATQAYFDDLGNGLEPLGDLLARMDVLNYPEHARPVLERFQARRPEIGAMVLFSPEGEMLLNTATKPGAKLPSLRNDQDYLKELHAAMADASRFTIGRPEFGKVLQQWRFPFRYTVRNAAGAPRFVLQAAIPLEQRESFFYQFPLPSQGVVGLLREDGYMQARWPVDNAEEVFAKVHSSPLADAIRRNPGVASGQFLGYSPWTTTGSRRIGAYTHLAHSRHYAYVSVPMTFVWSRWLDNNGPVLLVFLIFVAIFGAVTFRVAVHENSHSQELMTQARRDVLTGLPNRAGAEELLEHEVLAATEERRPISLMYFDLDRFKDINDALGHAAGDQLLVEVGKRVRTLLRQDDVLSRLGGDEFLAILPGSTGEAGIRTAERIIDAFRMPFLLEGHQTQVTTSIGIAVFPEHGCERVSLLKHADTAMYEAKRLGRSGYAFYESHLSEQVRQRFSMEAQLRDALKRGEFRLNFQPIIEFETGRIIKAEALVRWKDIHGVEHRPDKFIPIAEDSGLILPLGEWVLNAACKQVKAWLDIGMEIKISVNLSTRQFQDPHLVERVQRVLATSGIEASRLELEVTESAAMLDPESSIRVLGALKEIGIEIAIDDFGTGYSSLSYLKRIPANTIKIDKSFVDGICTNADDAAIVRTILALTHSMEKHAVAEGIETEDQLHALHLIGCRYGQGYLFSRPVAPEAFALLATGKNIRMPVLAGQRRNDARSAAFPARSEIGEVKPFPRLLTRAG
jgi:diguanylate cyclase (GGDEF)-like protein